MKIGQEILIKKFKHYTKLTTKFSAEDGVADMLKYIKIYIYIFFLTMKFLINIFVEKF